MKALIPCIFISLVSAIDLSGEHKSFSGYKIFEVVPATTEQVDIIHALSHDIEIDFQTEWRNPGFPTRFMLPPKKVKHTIDYIEGHSIDYKIISHDVGVQVANELNRQRSRAANNMVFDIDDFNTYDDIMTELDAMAARCPAALTCTVETLGVSYEGRDIKVIRISSGIATSGFWLDSTIHANEWLGPATTLKVLDDFTRNYGNDSDVTNLIDSFDWHFVPVMNPDGYEYTWTDNRNWRKSRNDNTGSNCSGTDLNRNYDTHWGTDGTSDNPCSGNYHGGSPASQPETQVIQTELVRLGPSLTVLVSVHSAGQMWLHPWGHTENGTCARAVDHDELYRVVTATADATQNTFGSAWTRGTVCETIYPASGSTCDFAYDLAGVPYTYTPELRVMDNDVPTDSIEPSYQEFWNGIKAMVAEIQASP